MLIVGKNCVPTIGQRVEKLGRDLPLESAFDFDFKSLVPPGTVGTIEETLRTAEEGDVCIVHWDNGEMQVCPYGPGSVLDLAIVEILPSNSNSIQLNPALKPFGKQTIFSSPAPQESQRSYPQFITTIGLRIYHGQKVDYVVPGGPAHLSNMLQRNDEVIAVDGMEVFPDTIQDSIVGNDVDGSMVTLTVRKEHTGNIFDVRLERVPKKNLQPMVDLIEQCEILKKRHGEARKQQNTYISEESASSPSTSAIIDDILSLLSRIMLEK
jgi:hypothetical protein